MVQIDDDDGAAAIGRHWGHVSNGHMGLTPLRTWENPAHTPRRCQLFNPPPPLVNESKLIQANPPPPSEQSYNFSLPIGCICVYPDAHCVHVHCKQFGKGLVKVRQPKAQFAQFAQFAQCAFIITHYRGFR